MLENNILKKKTSKLERRCTCVADWGSEVVTAPELNCSARLRCDFKFSVLTSNTCLKLLDMAASLDCNWTTTLLLWDC